MAGQGFNADALVQQILRNVSPREAECAGYDSLAGVGQYVQLLSGPVQLMTGRTCAGCQGGLGFPPKAA